MSEDLTAFRWSFSIMKRGIPENPYVLVATIKQTVASSGIVAPATGRGQNFKNLQTDKKLHHKHIYISLKLKGKTKSRKKEKGNPQNMLRDPHGCSWNCKRKVFCQHAYFSKVRPVPEIEFESYSGHTMHV